MFRRLIWHFGALKGFSIRLGDLVLVFSVIPAFFIISSIFRNPPPIFSSFWYCPNSPPPRNLLHTNHHTNYLQSLDLYLSFYY